MAKTIDELYSPAERAEILSACKIRIKFPRPRRCEVESVLFSVAPVRRGMSVSLGGLIKQCRDRGHQIIVQDFKGEFYKQEDQN